MKNIKGMQTFDWLMLAMVIWVLTTVNYAEMDLKDTVLVVCIVLWVIMLGIRLYIENFRNK